MSRRASNQWEVFNNQGDAYNRALGVLQLVLIGGSMLFFKDFILEALTVYTGILTIGCMGGFAILQALDLHWPKPADSYSRELLLLILLEVAFTLSLSQHRMYLWTLPLAINRFAYELACFFTYRSTDTVKPKIS